MGTIKHLSESQLVLYYYGEDAGERAAAAAHLEECPACRESYQALERLLGSVEALEVPEPAADYEAALWRSIAPRLARPARGWRPRWSWSLAAATCAALIAAALFTRLPAPKPLAPASDSQAGERVLRVAVGDYLDRSQMVLLELANTDQARTEEASWSRARDRASDLVSESRLYRQTAEHTGDLAVAHVLDELDRVLLDIAHGPDRLSARELERLHERLDAQGILFKIRVLSSNMRKQEL